MDPLAILDRLNTWRKERRAAEVVRAGATLRLAHDACHALVDLDDIRSDTGVLLHERVKSLYNEVSTALAGSLRSEDVEIVVRAIGSARIYYWIRYLNGHLSDELEELVRRRTKTTLPTSMSIVAMAMRAVGSARHYPPVPADGLSDGALAVLRSGCLEDFAKLELVVVRYATMTPN